MRIPSVRQASTHNPHMVQRSKRYSYLVNRHFLVTGSRSFSKAIEPFGQALRQRPQVVHL